MDAEKYEAMKDDRKRGYRTVIMAAMQEAKIKSPHGPVDYCQLRYESTLEVPETRAHGMVLCMHESCAKGRQKRISNFTMWLCLSLLLPRY